ncbi:MAG: hypothetical protein C0459_14905 [Chitinophaga sp.]|jgi:hypothetical protein|nr:hypothetical protein [Chitinophaga sp.]
MTINQIVANAIVKNPPISTPVFKSFSIYLKYKEISKRKGKQAADSYLKNYNQFTDYLPLTGGIIDAGGVTTTLDIRSYNDNSKIFRIQNINGATSLSPIGLNGTLSITSNEYKFVNHYNNGRFYADGENIIIKPSTGISYHSLLDDSQTFYFNTRTGQASNTNTFLIGQGLYTNNYPVLQVGDGGYGLSALNGQMYLWNGGSGYVFKNANNQASTVSIDGTGLISVAAGSSLYSSGNFGVYAQNAFYFRIGNPNSYQESIYVSNGSNVGIGTTNPQAKLHVNGDIKIAENSSLSVVSYGHNSGHDNTISFGQEGGTVKSINYFDGTYNNQYLTFNTHHGGVTIGERMRLDRDGNLGIGTSIPNEKLTITGNIHLAAERSEIYGADRNHMIVLRGRQDGTAADETSYYQYGDHVFYTNGPIATQTEKLRIKANGHIGIGTTNPDATLSIATNSPVNSGTSLLGVYNSTGSSNQWFRYFPSLGNGYYNGIVNNGDQGIVFSNDGDPNTNSGSFVIVPHNNIGLAGIKIFENGNVAIGTNDPGSYKLAVEGTIGARKVKVTQSPWADYVFKSNYNLRTLNEVEAYIKTHQHLPDVPSEKEVKADGLDVGETQAMLLRKIEELTLYMIEQQKRIDDQQKENEKQQKEIETLKKQINKK